MRRPWSAGDCCAIGGKNHKRRITKVALKIKKNNCLNFEVTAAVTTKNAIFCNVTPSDLAEISEL
jgi:hypothetical protein